jgi:pyrroline-5-carboxylate reductase
MNHQIAILGGGNIGLSLAGGLIKSGQFSPSDIFITRRNLTHLPSRFNKDFQISTDNKGAVERSEVIILAVLPQQLKALLAEIKPYVIPSRHLIISLVTGVSMAEIKKALYLDVAVVRAMPNTAISVGQSISCLVFEPLSEPFRKLVIDIFETVGTQIEIGEELMTSATALGACGIAFFLRAIRAATQGGVEIGFHAADALKISLQVAKGAALLLEQPGTHPENEIDKVTSPRGCTIAGLNEMEHKGFSSALITGIKTSAEKAGKLYE